MSENFHSLPNYFKIFCAADREMAHSAMLGALLRLDLGLGEQLFEGIYPSGSGEICLEVKIPDGRLDLAKIRKTTSEKLGREDFLFVLENKFKCQPSEKQLLQYNRFLGDAPKKVLLLLDNNTLYFTPPVGWHVTSYSHILKVLEKWLENSQNRDERNLLLVREYCKFLRGYLDMIKHYFNTLESTGDENEDRFLKRLFLARVAKKVKEILPTAIIGSDGGLTREPLLDIDFPAWNRVESPQIFIQVQGEKLKFYIRNLKNLKKGPGKGTDTETAILSYLEKLSIVTEADVRKMRSKFANHRDSMFIHEEKLTWTPDIDKMAEQIATFCRKINGEIEKAGQFY